MTNIETMMIMETNMSNFSNKIETLL